MESNISQWGTREEWLAKATDAGVPAAQAATAESIIWDQISTGAPTSRPPPVPAQEQNPRALLRAALRAGDPDAMTAMSVFGGMFVPNNSDEQTDRDRWAWRVLACHHGLDCSESATWYAMMCMTGGCQSHETVLDYLHRISAASNLGDIDKRAQELEATIDAEDWDDLGLGSPDPSSQIQ